MKRKKKTPTTQKTRKTKNTKNTRSRTAKPSRVRAGAPKVMPAREAPIDERATLPPPTEALPARALEVADEPVFAVALATPEPAYAARVPPPTPEPPLPANRRAIFYDVENASQPGHIAQVIEHLAIDRLGRRTDFVAVGNWRVIGADTARLLARHGAQLVHSAPSTGVRDWSDLRIAVSAGAWLAAARPGDVLEIVSDDRAFDAVGDVAAGLGIAFRRLSSRSLTDTGTPPPRETPEAGPKRERRGRYRRRGPRAPAPVAIEPRRAEPHRPAPAPHHPGPAHPHTGAAPTAHTAPHDEIVHVVRELVEHSPNRTVLIDSLARTLKARGFARTPGSPRLVTRLRRIKEIAVSPTGMVTLVGDGGTPAEPVAAAYDEPVAVTYDEPVAVTYAEAVAATPPEHVAASPAEAPEPARSTGPRRRRSRRGGRGRRRPASVSAGS